MCCLCNRTVVHLPAWAPKLPNSPILSGLSLACQRWPDLGKLPEALLIVPFLLARGKKLSNEHSRLVISESKQELS